MRALRWIGGTLREWTIELFTNGIDPLALIVATGLVTEVVLICSLIAGATR